jgi:DNA primase
MDPGARAKYLNSPETELFDKGRSLYNHGPAREAAGKGARLVVAEGYMDVIALVEAGFPAAVAPLGTAVTEDQLRMIWRIHPEPVIALDGDAAGFRAALRVIDLALPQVEAGQGLRFAVLPQGMDPDDLIRAEGAAGFRRVLEAAQPMAALLWRRETEGQVFDSPERRAALDKRLAAALAAIRDPGLRDHYRVEFDRLKRHLFAAAGDRPVRPVQGRRGDTGARAWPFDPRALAPATAATRASALAADGRAAERLREAAVVAALMHHPALLPEVEAELSRVDWTVPAHAELCRAILAGADAAQLAAGHAGALAVLLAQPLLAVTVGARPGDDADQARRCLRLALDLHLAPRRLSAEIADAEREITGFADEGLTWRVARAAEAVSNAPRLAPEDAAEAVVAPNGVAMDADERRRLDSLTQSIDFTRGGRSRRAED